MITHGIEGAHEGLLEWGQATEGVIKELLELRNKNKVLMDEAAKDKIQIEGLIAELTKIQLPKDEG